VRSDFPNRLSFFQAACYAKRDGKSDNKQEGGEYNLKDPPGYSFSAAISKYSRRLITGSSASNG